MVYVRNRYRREAILSSIGFSEILSSPAHGEIFDLFFLDGLKLCIREFK